MFLPTVGTAQQMGLKLFYETGCVGEPTVQSLQSSAVHLDEEAIGRTILYLA